MVTRFFMNESSMNLIGFVKMAKKLKYNVLDILLLRPIYNVALICGIMFSRPKKQYASKY